MSDLAGNGEIHDLIDLRAASVAAVCDVSTPSDWFCSLLMADFERAEQMRPSNRGAVHAPV